MPDPLAELLSSSTLPPSMTTSTLATRALEKAGSSAATSPHNLCSPPGTHRLRRCRHSFHAYFLRPGRHDVPIRFVVDRIRDGRTFTTRHVVAYQGGEAIFDLSVSFTHVELGIEHQDVMPAGPSPEGSPMGRRRGSALGDPSLRRPEGAIEIRQWTPTSRRDLCSRHIGASGSGRLECSRTTRSFTPPRCSTPATEPC